MNDRSIVRDIVTGDIDMDALQDRILKVFMAEISTEVMRGTPVDKGYMRQHWHEETAGRHQLILSNNTAYLPFHITGTGLYGPKHQMICAKGMSKKNPKYPHVMAWRSRGKTGMVFRRCTKGIRPNSFIETGIEAGITNAIDVLTNLFEGADHVVG